MVDATVCSGCGDLCASLYSDGCCFICSKTKEAKADRKKAKMEYRGLKAAVYEMARQNGIY